MVEYVPVEKTAWVACVQSAATPNGRMNTRPKHRTGSLKAIIAASLVALAAGCSTAPPIGINPVTPFDAARYAGKWYEIARLDNRFERGLSDVSASYRTLDDGGLEVINRGYDAGENRWREATGHAVFTGSPRQGSLEVTFFWPFHGGYHVAALDSQGYQWSMVVGPSRDYFWLLARDQQMSPDLRARLVNQARLLGIQVDDLVWVNHHQPDDKPFTP